MATGSVQHNGITYYGITTIRNLNNFVPNSGYKLTLNSDVEYMYVYPYNADITIQLDDASACLSRKTLYI